MSPQKADPRGVDRVWQLAATGYRIVDVDSDDLFVGVRMERDGDSVTLLLTRTDFAALFPNAELPMRDSDPEDQDVVPGV